LSEEGDLRGELARGRIFPSNIRANAGVARILEREGDFLALGYLAPELIFSCFEIVVELGRGDKFLVDEVKTPSNVLVLCAVANYCARIVSVLVE